MVTNRLCLIAIVAFSLWCASCQVGQARPLIDPTELNDDSDWIRDAPRDDVDDFGVGEGRVAEILEAAAKSKKSAAPSSNKESAYKQLDEIDRLKLSINKIICESMEEGCDHMDDMPDTPTEHTMETFANLKPDEYVNDD